MDELTKNNLEKQGYRIVGKHSAIKICLWCRHAIRDKGFCYKNTFYNISSNRCIQMSPAVLNCYHRCQFCWRDLDTSIAKEVEEPDEPDFIINECITKQKEILQGFRGGRKFNKQRFEEAMKPKHFALSLAGDATLYPLLPELIKKIHKKGLTTFLVTNGLRPDVLEKVNPTQMYITLPAPNEEAYKKICRPFLKDGWERLNNSLKLLKENKRGTIRLTLVKELNLFDPEGYAKIIKNLDFKFLELKAFMSVGYARYRTTYEQMPSFTEIENFAKEIVNYTNLKIIDFKKESRVILMAEQDYSWRKLKFE